MADKTINIGLGSLRSDSYFEKVYTEYFDRLFAYALVITKSESTAKDVVSDVFYGLWNSKKDLYTVKELKSYLYTSVKHQAIRAISKDFSRYHSDKYNLTIATIDGLDPEELLLGKELTEFIDKAVNKLPPQCGLVYRMIREDNLSYHDVARELGISHDTVKHHLKTAIKKLKGELENHFRESKVVKWASGDQE